MVIFAAVLLAVVGFFNLLDGIGGISTEAIAGELDGGASLEEVAGDFGLSIDAMRRAHSYELSQRAAG